MLLLSEDVYNHSLTRVPADNISEYIKHITMLLIWKQGYISWFMACNRLICMSGFSGLCILVFSVSIL